MCFAAGGLVLRAPPHGSRAPHPPPASHPRRRRAIGARRNMGIRAVPPRLVDTSTLGSADSISRSHCFKVAENCASFAGDHDVVATGTSPCWPSSTCKAVTAVRVASNVSLIQPARASCSRSLIAAPTSRSPLARARVARVLSRIGGRSPRSARALVYHGHFGSSGRRRRSDDDADALTACSITLAVVLSLPTSFAAAPDRSCAMAASASCCPSVPRVARGRCLGRGVDRHFRLRVTDGLAAALRAGGLPDAATQRCPRGWTPHFSRAMARRSAMLSLLSPTAPGEPSIARTARPFDRRPHALLPAAAGCKWGGQILGRRPSHHVALP